MPGPSSGCFVMTKSVRQHKIVKGGKLQKSESSLICVIIADGSTNALPVSTSILAHFCIPVSLHNKNVLLRRILLFRCHHGLTLGRTLVLLWCWKGLPSGGWWWACWTLGDIPWQCSQCPCEQEIQCHTHVYSLFHGRKPCVLPLLLFCQSSSISFHRVQGRSICSCPFRSLVPVVSQQFLVS